jgi:hypothetical protein
MSFTIHKDKIFSFFEKIRDKIEWKQKNFGSPFVSDSSNTMFTKYFDGFVNTKNIYELSLVFYKKDKTFNVSILLFQKLNKLKIASWENLSITESIKILDENFNLKGISLPSDVKNEDALLKYKSIDKYFLIYKRLTKTKSLNNNASSISLMLKKAQQGLFIPCYSYEDLETGKVALRKFLEYEIEEKDAFEMLLKEESKAIQNGYVDENSSLYIPEDANSSNWNFDLNQYKDKSKNIERIKKRIQKTKNEESNEDQGSTESEDGLDFDIYDEDIFSSNKSKKVFSQYDFGGYYNGNIPDYLGDMVGRGGSVDSSQISSIFSKTNDAISLVNQFDSSLLSNISFIFNFSKESAYGVYLSEMDRAIKTKALERQLISKGYNIINNNGMLEAHPENNNKDIEEINNDIDSLYSQIEQGGGTAIGINMNKVIRSATENANKINSPDSSLWEKLAVLHLGETIVHEAVHAQGHHDEGPSEAREKEFVQWALPKLNKEYFNSLQSMGLEDQFQEINLSKSIQWYKTAQNYYPSSILNKPSGSDLSGRHQGNASPSLNMSEWSMLLRAPHSNLPIESMLGRQFMSPLPPDLSQEHDIIDLQLAKHRGVEEIDAKERIYEELLSKDHDNELKAYSPIEELLDNKRPKPLMKTLKHASLIKEATVFGWYNNLEISDGSTIPGLGDRVMAWDDRDEDFAEDEKWIRNQPRYNPQYDLKGIYYRYIEPRFKPQLFDDMTKDYSNIHPAKRFASVNQDVLKIFGIIAEAKYKVGHNKIRATRFIVSEDILNPIKHILLDNKYNIKIFDLNNETFSVWIYSKLINEQVILEAEECFLKNEYKDFLKELFNTNEALINEILLQIKETSKEINEDIFIVGRPAYLIYTKESLNEIENIDCSANSFDLNLKIANILSEKLHVECFDTNHESYFIYKGIKVSFITSSVKEIENKLESKKIKATPLNIYMFNKDFTVNMIAYNIKNKKFKVPFDFIIDDIKEKQLRTFWNVNEIINKNYEIALRSIIMESEYDFKISEKLKEAIILFSEKIKKCIENEVSQFYKDKYEELKNNFVKYNLKEKE